MPIGSPSYSPEPKSGWRPVSRPIEAISCAESAATGSVSTRSFHAFVAGKIVQRGAPGTRSALAVPPPRSSAGSGDDEQAPHAAGSFTVTFVPSPCLLSSSIVPPCWSTSARVIASPRPVPGTASSLAALAR